MTEGARYERLQSYLARIPVDFDRQPEGIEDRPAHLRIGVGERLTKVWDAVEHRAGVGKVDHAVLSVDGLQFGERGLGDLAFLLQRPDAVADQDGIDAVLDRVELALDPLVDLADLMCDPSALLSSVLSKLGGKLLMLGAEVGEASRSENSGCEEGVDHLDQGVLADVLPFAVTERLGRLVAVADPVAAGVVGDPLAALAVHPQGVVAGGALDDAAEQIGAFLFAAPPRPLAATAPRDLYLDPLELLLADDRVVALGRLDPFLGLATDQRAFALLDRPEVESVPEEAAGVDGVLEDRPQGVLRPFACRVPARVDVARWGRAARAVQVIGDLLVAGAGEEAVEDLGDHRRPLGVDDEARLLVPGPRPGGVGMGLVAQAVAVGGAAAVAIALPRVLGLPAAHLAPQLLDLELVERLEHVADQPSLGAGLVARGERIEDLDPRPRHLALVGQRMEEVAAEPRGGVDDHGVEAAGVGILGLADQLAPSGSVVPATRLLVGEVADDLPAQLGRLRLALPALGREGQRRILLVLGREPSVPGELAHQMLLSAGMRGCGRYALTVTAKEKLLREVLDLDEAEAARARIVVPADSAEPTMVALPEGWGETLTGEPMPDVAAAVRRSRDSH